MHTQAGETFGATTGNDGAKEAPGHRRACLRGRLTVPVPRSTRISLVADPPPSLPSGCIRGAPFPAGLHRRQPAAAANLDKTQEQRVRGDPPGERTEEEESGRKWGEGRLRHRFKIRLLLPRVRGYLQILQRYRTYACALTEDSAQDWIRRIDNKQSRTRGGRDFLSLPARNFLRIAALRPSGPRGRSLDVGAG